MGDNDMKKLTKTEKEELNKADFFDDELNVSFNVNDLVKAEAEAYKVEESSEEEEAAIAAVKASK